MQFTEPVEYIAPNIEYEYIIKDGIKKVAVAHVSGYVGAAYPYDELPAPGMPDYPHSPANILQ